MDLWVRFRLYVDMHIHVYIHTYFGDCFCNYYPLNYSQTISARSFARDTVYCPFERSTFSIMRRVSFSSSSINSSSCNNGWVHGFDARLVKQICMDRVILQQAGAHYIPNVNCTTHSAWKCVCCIVRIRDFHSEHKLRNAIKHAPRLCQFLLPPPGLPPTKSQCVNARESCETVSMSIYGNIHLACTIQVVYTSSMAYSLSLSTSSSSGWSSTTIEFPSGAVPIALPKLSLLAIYNLFRINMKLRNPTRRISHL